MNLNRSQLEVIESILADICAALIISLTAIKSSTNLLYYLLLIVLIFLLAVKFDQIKNNYDQLR